MKVKPVLDSYEIPCIESVVMTERRELVEFPVAGKAGSLYQDLNAAPARIAIAGSLYGDDARSDFLSNVRDKFKAGAAVTFVADILTATDVQYVVIEALDCEQNAQHPDQLDYRMVLRESPPPPPPPNPLGGLETSLLDEAGSLIDGAAGLLEAIDSLGSIPDLKDPTQGLKGTLDGVSSAVSGLDSVQDLLNGLFGSGE